MNNFSLVDDKCYKCPKVNIALKLLTPNQISPHLQTPNGIKL